MDGKKKPKSIVNKQSNLVESCDNPNNPIIKNESPLNTRKKLSVSNNTETRQLSLRKASSSSSLISPKISPKKSIKSPVKLKNELTLINKRIISDVNKEKSKIDVIQDRVNNCDKTIKEVSQLRRNLEKRKGKIKILSSSTSLKKLKSENINKKIKSRVLSAVGASSNICSSSSSSVSNNNNNNSKKPKKSSRATTGQKWFKGPKKSRKSNLKSSKSCKQLKRSLNREIISSPTPNHAIPAKVVEFEIDGITEQISIKDELHIIDSEPFYLVSQSSFSGHEDSPIFPSSPIGIGFNKKSKIGQSCGKGKGKVSKILSNKNKMVTPSKLQKAKNSKHSNKKGSSSQSNYFNTPHNEDKKIKLPEASYKEIEDYQMKEASPRPNAYIRYMERPQEDLETEIEYELDEEDCAWLELANDKRKEGSISAVKPEVMEILMDRLEKESYFQMQTNGMDQGPFIDDDAVCCICMDGECQNSNAILFCDMCNLAVHQECYGVPYIPEGQWLCRRCLQSPSRAPDCALCPNKGGAFKQTNDGRWGHVVCAIWIPEVCFANTVFLEPIDSIGDIPAARWRLCCYICKQKSVGACIQCHKSNCYTAFHVTCAQQAGLSMKMDTVREHGTVIVKKIAFCDNHAPPEKEDDIANIRQKMRQARKLLAEKRSAIPIISIPTIPNERVAQISSSVTFPRKNQFMKRVMAYWQLKRQKRNGVPLLRRLQAAALAPLPGTKDGINIIHNPNEVESLMNCFRYCVRLRQDLEKARLLCELVRKREKKKRELIHVQSKLFELKLQPMVQFLLKVLEEISSKDTQGIFAEPVDTNEVVDYLDVIENPMDLSTMKEKIISYIYQSVEDLELDFNLMINNCLRYNSRDTIFYRIAGRLKEFGGLIIRQAKREWKVNGYDSKTGLHTSEEPPRLPVLKDEQIIAQVDKFIENPARHAFTYDVHLEQLELNLDKALCIKKPAFRKKKFYRIRQEIQKLKRLKYLKLNSNNEDDFNKIQKFKRKSERELLHSDSDTSLIESSQQELNMPFLRRLSTTNQNNNNEEEEEEKSDSQESNTRVLRPPKRKTSVNEPKSTSTPTSSNLSSPNKRLKSTILNKSTISANKSPIRSRVSMRRQSTLSINQGDSSNIISNGPFKNTSPQQPSKVVAKDLTPKKTGSVNRRTAVLFSSKKTPQKNYINNNLVVKSGNISSSQSESESRTCNIPNNNNNNILKTRPNFKSQGNNESPEKTKTRTSTRTLKNKTSNNSLTLTPTKNSKISPKKNNILSKNEEKISSPPKNNSAETKLKEKKIKTPPRPIVNRQHNGRFASSSQEDLDLRMAFSNSVAAVLGNRTLMTTISPKKSDSFSVYRTSGGDGVESEEEENGRITVKDSIDSSIDSSSSSEEEEEESAASISSRNSSTGVVPLTLSEKSESEEDNSSKDSSNEDSMEEVNVQLNEKSFPNLKGKNEISSKVKTSKENLMSEEEQEEGLIIEQNQKKRADYFKKTLKPLDLVWGKGKEDSWYPGLVINPDNPKGTTQNGVEIPGPPPELLELRPKHGTIFLVLFFDHKRTWEWIERSNLVPLGKDPNIDKGRLDDNKSTKNKKGIRKAYERALLHESNIQGFKKFSDPVHL